jgi:hypothetical protein
MAESIDKRVESNKRDILPLQWSRRRLGTQRAKATEVSGEITEPKRVKKIRPTKPGSFFNFQCVKIFFFLVEKSFIKNLKKYICIV